MNFTTDAYEAGVEDFDNGTPFKACPFIFDAKKAREWQEGWNSRNNNESMVIKNDSFEKLLKKTNLLKKFGTNPTLY